MRHAPHSRPLCLLRSCAVRLLTFWIVVVTTPPVATVTTTSTSITGTSIQTPASFYLFGSPGEAAAGLFAQPDGDLIAFDQPAQSSGSLFSLSGTSLYLQESIVVQYVPNKFIPNYMYNNISGGIGSNGYYVPSCNIQAVNFGANAYCGLLCTDSGDRSINQVVEPSGEWVLNADATSDAEFTPLVLAG